MKTHARPAEPSETQQGSGGEAPPLLAVEQTHTGHWTQADDHSSRVGVFSLLTRVCDTALTFLLFKMMIMLCSRPLRRPLHFVCR
jgi:hypothetical protein